MFEYLSELFEHLIVIQETWCEKRDVLDRVDAFGLLKTEEQLMDFIRVSQWLWQSEWLETFWASSYHDQLIDKLLIFVFTLISLIGSIEKSI